MQLVPSRLPFSCPSWPSLDHVLGQPAFALAQISAPGSVGDIPCTGPPLPCISGPSVAFVSPFGSPGQR